MFNFYIKEYRVVVHKGGGLVNRLSNGWGRLQRKEGILANIKANSIVNFLVKVFKQIRFKEVRVKLRRRYFNKYAIVKPILAKLALHG